MTPLLSKQFYVCPKGLLVNPSGNGSVSQVIAGDHHDFWIALSEPAHAPLLDGTAALLKCRSLCIPDERPADARAARRHLETELQHIARSLQRHRKTRLRVPLGTPRAAPGNSPPGRQSD